MDEDRSIMADSIANINSIMSRVKDSSKLICIGRDYYVNKVRLDKGFEGKRDDID